MTEIPDWVRTAIAALDADNASVPEIFAWVPLAWTGWEGDHTAVLLKRKGSLTIEILGRIDVGTGAEEQVLRERIAAYRQLAADTETFLRQLAASPGTNEPELNEELGWTMKQLRDRVAHAGRPFREWAVTPFRHPRWRQRSSYPRSSDSLRKASGGHRRRPLLH